MIAKNKTLRPTVLAFLNVKDGTFKKSNSLFGASVLVAF